MLVGKLSLISIVAIFGSISSVVSYPPNTRIVGGFPVDIANAPWQVSLQTKGGLEHYCGGAIIGDRWVLTTLRCLRQPLELYVRVGASRKYDEGQVIRAQRVIAHKEYNPFDFDNNYGLIELRTKLEFTDRIQPIRLPAFSDTIENGTLCTVTGWGLTYNPNESTVSLRGVEVPIQHDCRPFSRIGPSMICAGKEAGKDFCNGDSGAPLVHYDSKTKEATLIGLASFGFPKCGEPGIPGVYSRVSYARQWIHEFTNL